MSNKVLSHLSDDSVSLAYNFNGVSKFITVDNSDPKFQQIVKLLSNKDDEGLYKLLTDQHQKLQQAYENKDFEVIDNGLVKIGNDVLPPILSKRLISFAEKKIPYQALLNFWKRLSNNPSMRAVNELFGCLDRNHHPIYEDGCFLAWKGLRGNYTDVHSGKFVNTVGSKNRMDRRSVDDDNVNSCSYGFHVGSYEYAKSFARGKFVEVKVDPADVVAVPTDANWQKMRVCAYEVVADCTEFNDSEVVDWDDDEE